MANQAPGLSKLNFSNYRRIRNVLFAGDSISTYQGTLGRTFSGLVNITGVELRYATVNCPTSGTGTLAWDFTNKTLTWTAPGDTPGTPVPVQNGIYYLPSGTAGYQLRVGVYPRSLPNSNKVDTLTPGTLLLRRGGYAYILEAILNRSVNILEDHGIGGNQSQEVLARANQMIQASPDIVFEESGTNDLVAGGAAPSTVIQNRTTLWDTLIAAGIPVGAYLVMPRSASLAVSGVAGSDGSSVTTFGPKISATNNGLINAAKSVNRNSVFLIDSFSPLVDTATGRMRNYSSDDGLHPSGDMSIELAIPASNLVQTLSPDVHSVTNVGAMSQYDAVNCISGNLLKNNQGSFAGTGGTLGTGASLTQTWVASTTVAVANVTHVIYNGNLYKAVNSGTAGTTAPVHLTGAISDGSVIWSFVASGASTGFAAGYNVLRWAGSNATVQCHKMQATDGGPDWQEFIISGATTDQNANAQAESIRFYPDYPIIGNFNVGDILDTSCQLQLPYGAGVGCYGMTMENLYSGVTVTHDNICLSKCARGVRITDPFTLALHPIPFLSGTTAILSRVNILARAGFTFYVRARNYDFHKVI